MQWIASSASMPSKRGAQDLLRLGVDQHLHEALRLGAFAGAADARHHHLARQRRPSRGADLALGHADARERRVGEQRVDGDAVGDAAPVVVEQVRGDDLVVVVGRVREGAAAVDVAQRPDARRAGAQLVVDVDVAAGIGRDPGAVEPQVVRVGLPSHGQQHVRAVDFARLFLAAHMDADAAVALVQRRHCGVQPEGDAFAFEHRLDRGRDFLVLARDDARRHLDDRDAAAEAPVHLRELEADVAAADDDQVLGQEIDVHHAGAREERHVADALASWARSGARRC